jgi:hypothetical protein
MLVLLFVLTRVVVEDEDVSECFGMGDLDVLEGRPGVEEHGVYVVLNQPLVCQINWAGELRTPYRD